MGAKETIERAAKEVKALANAQRTHVGRLIATEPVDLKKLDLPERVAVSEHETGFLVSADPDEHPDAVKR